MRNSDPGKTGQPSNPTRDIFFLLALCVATFVASSYFDALEAIVEFVQKHESFQLDELITVCIILTLALTCYSVKRWQELLSMNRVIGRKNDDLQKALGEVKQLKGILPICASCKRIRDDKGYWQQVEAYISEHTDADFSHGLCPECMKALYPDFVKE